MGVRCIGSPGRPANAGSFDSDELSEPPRVRGRWNSHRSDPPLCRPWAHTADVISSRCSAESADPGTLAGTQCRRLRDTGGSSSAPVRELWYTTPLCLHNHQQRPALAYPQEALQVERHTWLPLDKHPRPPPCRRACWVRAPASAALETHASRTKAIRCRKALRVIRDTSEGASPASYRSCAGDSGRHHEGNL
jgi:hypothetical protein